MQWTEAIGGQKSVRTPAPPSSAPLTPFGTRLDPQAAWQRVTLARHPQRPFTLDYARLCYVPAAGGLSSEMAIH